MLRSYLNFGGGLVFFLGRSGAGRRTTTGSWRARQATIGTCCRPGWYGPSKQAHYGLDPLGYRHPLVGRFRDAEQAGLLTTPVHKYFKLQLTRIRRGAGGCGRRRMATRSSSTRPIGRGRSMLVATCADVVLDGHADVAQLSCRSCKSC